MGCLIVFDCLQDIKQFLTKDVTQCRILVLGDVMLDRYYFGEVKRISPEAPVPITRVLSERDTLGGAANVAHNLALLGCKTFLIGAVGNDDSKARLCHKLDEVGIDYNGLVSANIPTTTKLRIIGGHQQMLRLDFEETGELDSQVQDKILEATTKLVQQGLDAVIISDYAKGVCSLDNCSGIINICKSSGIPVVVDPKGSEWYKYSHALYITPNMKEITEALKTHIKNEDNDVQKAAKRLRKKFSIENIVVTRSEKGLSLINSNQVSHIPTHAQEVFDVSGAGDTVIAVMGAALAGKLSPNDAAKIANIAAGIVVGKLGTYAISKDELLMAVEHITAKS